MMMREIYTTTYGRTDGWMDAIKCVVGVVISALRLCYVAGELENYGVKVGRQCGKKGGKDHDIVIHT